jgi:Zinc binding domain
MPDCCPESATQGAAPAVRACPLDGTPSKQVQMLTVRSLVRRLPLGMPETQYYFCEARSCDAVYFALDPRAPVFRRGDLAIRIGAKEESDPIPVCYCFGFTRQDLWDEVRESGKPTAAEKIRAEVEAGRCACEVKNPSGKCCLGDVARTARLGLDSERRPAAMNTEPSRSAGRTPSKGALAAGVSAIGSVLAAATCCLPVLPFVLAAGSAGSAAFLSRYASVLRPYLLTASVVFIALGFYQSRRASRCNCRPSLLSQIVLWVSALIVAVAILLPQAFADLLVRLL